MAKISRSTLKKISLFNLQTVKGAIIECFRSFFIITGKLSNEIFVLKSERSSYENISWTVPITVVMQELDSKSWFH